MYRFIYMVRTPPWENDEDPPLGSPAVLNCSQSNNISECLGVVSTNCDECHDSLVAVSEQTDTFIY